MRPQQHFEVTTPQNSNQYVFGRILGLLFLARCLFQLLAGFCLSLTYSPGGTQHSSQRLQILQTQVDCSVGKPVEWKRNRESGPRLLWHCVGGMMPSWMDKEFSSSDRWAERKFLV